MAWQEAFTSVTTTKEEMNHSPPAYCLSQVEQTFVICDSILDGNRKVFTSERSMRMYKEYKKLGKSNPTFKTAKLEQNMSIGLPLMFCRRKFQAKIGEINYLSIYICLPCPEANDRLYEEVDNRHIAEVFKNSYLGYHRYRLQISNEEITMILHSRLPIVDFQIYNERFRFIKAKGKLFDADYFAYELFLLGPKQISLTDNLGPDRKVSQTNELLGSQLRNLFPIKFSSTDRSSFMSTTKLGKFEHKGSQVVFSRTRMTSTFSIFVDAGTNLDQNNDVTFRNKIFVAIVLILQAYEDDLASKRQFASSF